MRPSPDCSPDILVFSVPNTNPLQHVATDDLAVRHVCLCVSRIPALYKSDLLNGTSCCSAEDFCIPKAHCKGGSPYSPMARGPASAEKFCPLLS